MKTTPSTLLRICCVSALLLTSVFGATQEELRVEFTKINQERTLRSELINFLKKTAKVRETENGTLAAADPKDAELARSVDTENAARERQFDIIAELQGQPEQEIRAAFALKMGVAKKETITPILRIHGSNTVGEKLAPELVREWLDSRNVTDVSMKRSGVFTQFVFRDSVRDQEWKSVEILAHGTSTAFQQDQTYPEVGLAGGFCDVGMASRQIKDQEAEALIGSGLGDLRKEGSVFPVAVDGLAIFCPQARQIPSLTVAQVADIFSGEITNWSEVGGSNEAITLYARDAHSGTFDSFESKVLKPLSKKLSPQAKRYESSSELVRDCASDPSGIGFVGLAYANTSVNVIPICASAETRPLIASRLAIKSLDYPLARLLYFYAPAKRSALASDYLDFAISDRGQQVVDRVGLIGQGKAMASDMNEADALKKSLLQDGQIPPDYKKIVQNADRRDTLANVRFESGELSPDANSRQNLRRLANFLASPGNENAKVICIGFADNKGSDTSNLQVSKSRAEAVAAQLSSLGVREVQTVGFGEAMPVADNNTSEGRAANRRVEIWLQR
jgi:phosphate transport system substrate-binding protein